MRGFQISEHGSSQVLKFLTDLAKPAIKTGMHRVFSSLPDDPFKARSL
jgi:hypothetical protein